MIDAGTTNFGDDLPPGPAARVGAPMRERLARAAPLLAAALLVAIHAALRVGLGEAFADPVRAAWLGGARIPMLIDGGQWWRVVTAAFVHLDPEHLAVNAVALALIGPVAAGLVGPRRFWIAFVGTAVAGSALGHALGGGWSVGASGGIFGLLGLIGGHAARRWPAWMASRRRRVLLTTLPWAVLLTAAPFLSGDLAMDHAAHLGGLAAGGVAGFAGAGLRRRPGVDRALAVAALGLVAACFGFAAAHAHRQSVPPTDWRLVRGDAVTYEVPAGWLPAPPPDREACDTAFTDGVLFVCVGRRPDGGALPERLAREADEAGFEPDTALPRDPGPAPGWPTRLVFRPRVPDRAGQRLALLLGPPEPRRRLVVVHALTTAALTLRTQAILHHIAASARDPG